MARKRYANETELSKKILHFIKENGRTTRLQIYRKFAEVKYSSILENALIPMTFVCAGLYEHDNGDLEIINDDK